MSDTILANATLVLPHEVITGSLRLSDGLITAIDTGVHVPAGAEDCGGDLIMPGLPQNGRLADQPSSAPARRGMF